MPPTQMENYQPPSDPESKQLRIEEINAQLMSVHEDMRQLNALHGRLYDERWGLQCDLMQEPNE